MLKENRFWLKIFFSMLTCINAQAAELYSGEYVEQNYRNFPSLLKSEGGDRDKPLMVFVPGSAHLARIAYAFPDGAPEDFLSHWLHDLGYSFLGVSYPISHPAFSSTHPDFSIQDWRAQVIAAVCHTCAKYRLNKKTVVLVWSLAGVMVTALAEAAQREG